MVGATSRVTFLYELDDLGRSKKSVPLSSGGGDTVRAVAFADEDTVIVGDDHGRVVRWRIGETPHSDMLISEGTAITSLLVRNGRLLVGRGDEVDSIELNSTANEVVTISKGFGWIDSLALSDDGKRLAVGYADGSIGVFATDQPSTQPIILNVHGDIVRALAFDRAGDTLVSVGDDGIIKSTAVGETRLGDLACKMLWRDLSQEEITSYFGSTLPPTIPSCPNQAQ
ncbi:WD40 repeat domain-containing protein [Bradyrhizobium sp. Arg62]|uniref:WD40 repeat domain-containing protein n=1 Tax=Bradyrhizobium brasilense TaxID=1419277 RepID=UPI001E594F3D|nr:WD40 repeat domain-containing protein [Bradyrhizobium brasilense]MCC8948181.1 WD40 repeat domain-containing protein [Bradyrhizobium brasilense]